MSLLSSSRHFVAAAIGAGAAAGAAGFAVVSVAVVGIAAPGAVAQTALTTARIASGLDRPLWIGCPPGDSRLYALEQEQADIHLIDVAAGLPVEAPFLDLSAKVIGDQLERGLLGLAFDPDYPVNGFFYVYYTRQPDSATVVERYHALDPAHADPSSGVVVFGPMAQPQTNHNGGNIRFGPDGLLYVGTGDGGNYNDTGFGHVAGGNAQSGGQILGKILRIAKDGSIPADNPFLAPGDGFLDAIWAYGVRNPWRWSFDRVTGDFWLGDVGQDLVEEIDILPAAGPAGRNLGWRCMEGSSCTGLDGCTCADAALALPIHEYAHGSAGCCVIGGFVYRGPSVPDLQGSYFFADYCSSRVWSLAWDGSKVTSLLERTEELAPGLGLDIANITSFGEDDQGELLVVDGGGEIYRIVKDPFTDLHSALPGADGRPRLKAEGGLLPGSQNRLLLSKAAPLALSLLFVSIGEGNAAFKGGVLKSVPVSLALSATTTASGTAEIAFAVPPGVAAGIALVMQFAIQDAVAVQGVALSNALKAVTP